MAQLEAALSATLVLKPGKAAAPYSVAPGYAFSFCLRDAHATPQGEIAQVLQEIDSPNAFVALPFPANLRARVLYLRVMGRDEVDLRITQATAGQRTIDAVAGSFFVEVGESEEITAVAIQGSATIEWVAFGTIV